MINSKTFFEQVDFDFDKELKPINIAIANNTELSQKLTGKAFRYTPINDKTQCVFTLFDISVLNENEIFEIRKHIWNENKSDLLFIKIQDKLCLLYSFSDPLKSPIIIDSFTGKEEDRVLLRKISKSNFDTGIFWDVYQNIQADIRKKRLTVDRGLIKTLRLLRQKLQVLYSNYIKNREELNEIVQALIDRTLFIKFLEDKLIINSFFYEFYYDSDVSYIQLLRSQRKDDINRLFEIINNLFNNTLFVNPVIPAEKLFDEALILLADALDQKNFETGQLYLFSYRFDVIPTEFIGHVYEMFFDDNQADEGIFYTPEGLASLIIEETIDETGSILDPSCGSGMFLVVGLRKLFDNENLRTNVSVHDIKKRNKILVENIFGIEKQENARRLAILSLYLELLDGIDSTELQNFIKDKISLEENLKIFPYDFTENIVHGNALEVTSIVNKSSFDYVVGNPPFLTIKEGEKEEAFWKKHKTKICNKQLSQCFFVKILNWCTNKTKLGFVSNLSNFNSDASDKFQHFFYKFYNIKKFYNLAKIKGILFENAKESTAVILFTVKTHSNNKFIFLTPKLTEFSKLFKIVILRADDSIEIDQCELINNNKSLKEFFVGDEHDLSLTAKIRSQCDSLAEYLDVNSVNATRLAINNGIQILGSGNQSSNWKTLSKEEKNQYREEFFSKYSHWTKSKEYVIPFLECANIEPFAITGKYRYLKPNIESYKNIFERVRTNKDFEGERILFPRTGAKLKAIYTNNTTYYCFDIYSIQLKVSNLYPLIVAILNSNLINYYIMIRHRKRILDSYPKITMEDVKKIPIPILYNDEIQMSITKLSSELINSQLNSNCLIEEINQLVYKLYGLNKYDCQKVNDFFLKSKKINNCDLQTYIDSFISTIQPYFSKDIEIYGTKYIDRKMISSFVGVKFEFIAEDITPNPNIDQVVNSSLLELLQEVGNVNIYTMKNMIIGKNSLFFIRENDIKNWSISKAYEDAQNFLMKLFVK